MKALVMDAIGKPMVVKDFPQPECPSDGAIVAFGNASASIAANFLLLTRHRLDSLLKSSPQSLR